MQSETPATDNQAAAEQAAAALAPVSRRRFLRYTFFGAAGLAVASGGLFTWLRRSPVDRVPVPDSIKHLAASEYHLFDHAIKVLLPTENTSLTPVQQVPVIEHIDAMIGLLPDHLRSEVSIGLTLFDNAAVIAGLHGRRFVDLTDQQAVAYFDRWSQGGTIQRALSTLIKRFVYVAYWRDPVTWPPVEFDGPVTDRWGLDYLGNAPLPESDQPGVEA